MRLVLHRKPVAERWRHIYGCHKRKLLTICGFAELSFECSEWDFSKDEWKDHCQDHLRRPEPLPIQCNPFVYGGTLACAGYCLFCLGDAALPALIWLQQFLDREKWKAYIDRHIERLDGCIATKCPHPRPKCVNAFPSVLEMNFQPPGCPLHRFYNGTKRRRSGSEVDTMSARRKRSRKTKDHDPDVKLACPYHNHHVWTPFVDLAPQSFQSCCHWGSLYRRGPRSDGAYRSLDVVSPSFLLRGLPPRIADNQVNAACRTNRPRTARSICRISIQLHRSGREVVRSSPEAQADGPRRSRYFACNFEGGGH